MRPIHYLAIGLVALMLGAAFAGSAVLPVREHDFITLNSGQDQASVKLGWTVQGSVRFDVDIYSGGLVDFWVLTDAQYESLLDGELTDWLYAGTGTHFGNTVQLPDFGTHYLVMDQSDGYEQTVTTVNLSYKVFGAYPVPLALGLLLVATGVISIVLGARLKGERGIYPADVASETYPAGYQHGVPWRMVEAKLPANRGLNKGEISFLSGNYMRSGDDAAEVTRDRTRREDE